MKTILLIIITSLTMVFYSNSQTFEDDNFMMAYVVVADTGKDYNYLRQQMETISADLHIEIDSLGRFYNKQKNLICLLDNHEDEMYAGQYYPRRYTGEFLSLEYFQMYRKDTDGITIGLIAGIFEEEEDAKIRLHELKSISKTAHVVYCELIIGCLH